MEHNRLAQKRFAKKLRRKNKKYTGPKFSRLEQLMLIAPLLERGGIEIFEKVEEEIYDGSPEATTSFTISKGT
jgi:hypothetical protein